MKKNRLFCNIIMYRFIGLGLIMSLSLAGVSQEDMLHANLDVQFIDGEDSKTIRVFATDPEGLPIADMELYFFVQRTFSLLPVGDDFSMTDEEGMVEIVFPDDLPGIDEEGNVEIIVRLEDHDVYGDQDLKFTKSWGNPIRFDKEEVERSLWAASANAPIPLIIIVNSLLFVVYFIIIYIIFELFKIRSIKSS